MNNIIDAINELIKGVNIAYARGAYSMLETHDLHKAMEFIKEAASVSSVDKTNTEEVGQNEVKTAKDKN